MFSGQNGKMKKILLKAIVGVHAAAFLLFSVLAWKEADTCRSCEGVEAIVSCSLLIKHIPVASMKAGFLAERAARYEKAGMQREELADLGAAVGLTGKLPPEKLLGAYNRLTRLNFQLDKEAEALKYADLAVQNGSLDAEVYMARASMELKRNKCKAALADLEKAQSLGYDQPALYINLASANMGLGRFDTAYQASKKAGPKMLTEDDKGQLSRVLGLTCFELKRYAESVRHLNKALSYGLNCPDCSEAIAMAQQLAATRAPAGKKRAKAH